MGERTQPVGRSLPLTSAATLESRITEVEETPEDKTVTSAVRPLRPFSSHALCYLQWSLPPKDFDDSLLLLAPLVLRAGRQR